MAGGASLAAPTASLGWLLLFGIIVRTVTLQSEERLRLTCQPLGLIGQYTVTYAMQRVPAVQVSIVQYTGVSFPVLVSRHRFA